MQNCLHKLDFKISVNVWNSTQRSYRVRLITGTTYTAIKNSIAEAAGMASQIELSQRRPQVDRRGSVLFQRWGSTGVVENVNGQQQRHVPQGATLHRKTLHLLEV